MLVATKGSSLSLKKKKQTKNEKPKEREKQKQKISQKAQSTFPIHHGPYYPEVIPIPIPNYTLPPTHYVSKPIYLILIARPKNQNPNSILFHSIYTYLLT